MPTARCKALFCILFWASKRVWRLAGRNPPVLLLILKTKVQQIDDLLHPVS